VAVVEAVGLGQIRCLINDLLCLFDQALLPIVIDRLAAEGAPRPARFARKLRNRHAI
jgi:hypothetical protein